MRIDGKMLVLRSRSNDHAKTNEEDKNDSAKRRVDLYKPYAGSFLSMLASSPTAGPETSWNRPTEPPETTTHVHNIEQARPDVYDLPLRRNLRGPCMICHCGVIYEGPCMICHCGVIYEGPCMICHCGVVYEGPWVCKVCESVIQCAPPLKAIFF
jgi:hypothetical protein